LPFTPFHFGPGLLIKSAAPARFSFLAYAAAQVAIDVEPLVHMARGEWPIHRAVHTFLVAPLVGLAAGALTCAVAFRRPRPPGAAPALRGESAWAGVVAGGVIGGLLHPFLDGLMHPDVQPFQPFMAANPLLGRVSLAALYFGCVTSGLLGIGLLVRPRLWRRTTS
jgi:membrane-bound metal-dependent hydrolase YbcI (DUF457 family)